MAICDWSDTFALGIGQIDNHHRHLFTLLNNTYDTFVTPKRRVEVEEVLEALVDYATYHFSAEERLMSRHTYQHADLHRKEHAYFMERIKVYQREFTGGRKTLPLELIVFLKDWLLDHIAKSDKAYAEIIGPKLKKRAAAGSSKESR